MSAGRQGSIAGYFSRTPTKSKNLAPSLVKDEVIDLTFPESIDTTVSDGPPAKRRRVSPKGEAREASPLQSVADKLKIDTTIPFDYPPADHPSYSRPPSPAYNHPITIRPPATSLLDSLTFSQSPKSILKPSLNLDLLYFHPFISPPASRQLFDYFLDHLPWYRVKYTVRGISINTPRWTTVFGKDASTKAWTGYTVKPRAIPEILLRLMEIGESTSPNKPLSATGWS